MLSHGSFYIVPSKNLGMLGWINNINPMIIVYSKINIISVDICWKWEGIKFQKGLHSF